MNYKKISTWFIIAGVLVISIIYGISFFLSFFSNPEQQLAKNIFQKQMDRELAKGPNKKLADLNAEAKKRHLTTIEEDEIVAKTEEAEMIRKKYESKLTPPSQKPVSAKPKEKVWDWTFKWERNDKQWEEAKSIGRKKKGEAYPARILEITQSKIIMEYVSGYSGKPEEVTLRVGNTGDFWASDYFVKNKNPKEIDLSLKVSLYKDPESPGNFTGIFWQDQDGQQVDCWLSKKQQ